jgi:hypothetical protein
MQHFTITSVTLIMGDHEAKRDIDLKISLLYPTAIIVNCDVLYTVYVCYNSKN